MNPWGLAVAVVEYGFPSLVAITFVSLAFVHKWRREEDVLFSHEELCPYINHNLDRCELPDHHKGPHKVGSNWYKNADG